MTRGRVTDAVAGKAVKLEIRAELYERVGRSLLDDAARFAARAETLRHIEAAAAVEERRNEAAARAAVKASQESE